MDLLHFKPYHRTRKNQNPKKKRREAKKKKIESSSDESSSSESSSSESSSDESDESSEEEEPVPKKLSKKQRKKKMQEKKRKAELAKEAARKEELEKERLEKERLEKERLEKERLEKERKEKEEATRKKEASSKPKKKMTKKQRKRAALAAAKEKEEAEAREKEEKKRKEKLEKERAAAAKLAAEKQKKMEEKKALEQKKKEEEEARLAQLAKEAEEDDGWEKVPSKGSRRNRKKANRANKGGGDGAQKTTSGPIVREILELGCRPSDPKAVDEVRQRIFKVIGFPPRSTRDGEEPPPSGRREDKFQRNKELFKTKLNVDMEFKQTKSKYYLLMNGSPSDCKQAILAATQLFENGYSDILTPGMTKDTILVESHLRGAVVGQGAANIRAITDEYSVQITLPPRDGQSDEVKLSGPIEGVKKAKVAIMQLMMTGISDVTHPDSGVATVMVPNRRKWILIGPKGSNIRRIQDAYDCRITVPQNVDGQKPDDLVPVMVACPKESIEAAVNDIKESISEPEPEQLPGFSKELTCEYDPWAEE